jgi:hypothetical protein
MIQPEPMLLSICSRAALGVVLLGLAGLSSKVSAACLPYEPTSVVLQGTLKRLTFPGPPNYESIRSGDKPETGYYLALPSAVCTDSSPDDPNLEAKSRVRLVQLVLTEQGYSGLRPFLGKSVRVRGRLFSAFTGHHHAPLLLDFERLESR